MTDLFLLSQAQMRRIVRYFPFSHGGARVDDRRIVGAIVFVIRNGLGWTPRLRTVRTRQSTISLFVGAACRCRASFSPRWRARVTCH